METLNTVYLARRKQQVKIAQQMRHSDFATIAMAST
jgi:hypothetical protein